MATYDEALLAYQKLAGQFGSNWQTPAGNLVVTNGDYSVGVTIMQSDPPDPEVPTEIILDDGTRVPVMTLRVAASFDAFLWPDEPFIFKRISVEDVRAKKAELIEAGWGDNPHVSGIGIGIGGNKSKGYQLAIRLVDVMPPGLMEAIDGFPCDIRITGAIEFLSLSDEDVRCTLKAWISQQTASLKVTIDPTAQTVTFSRNGFEFVAHGLTDGTPAQSKMLFDTDNQRVIYQGETYPATITVIGQPEE